MKDILIYGSATHHNLGDLAMMQGLISYLKALHPEKRTVLVTRNPDLSRQIFDIPCISFPDRDISSPDLGPPRRGLVILRGMLFVMRFVIWRYISRRVAGRLTPSGSLSFFEALSNADALVVHGSGSFNSVFWHGWLYPKAFCAICASLFRVPVMMTSQGIGPLHSRLDRLMAGIFFRRAKYIGVRDGDFSRDQAMQSGAPKERLYHTGDDSTLLPKITAAETDAALASEDLPTGRLLIGVNFRDASSYHPSYREPGYQTLAASLDEIIRRHNAHVVFIPITYDPVDDDRKSAAQVAVLMAETAHTTVIRGEHPATVIRGIVGRMHVAVGASYHFLLFALTQGVPAVALTKNNYYLCKHLGLLALYGQQEHRIDMVNTENRSQNSGPSQVRQLDRLARSEGEDIPGGISSPERQGQAGRGACLATGVGFRIGSKAELLTKHLNQIITDRDAIRSALLNCQRELDQESASARKVFSGLLRPG